MIGLETSGSAPYRASALKATDLETDDVPEMKGERLSDIVDDDISGLDDLYEGWDRNSVLEYWEGVGGSWEEYVDDEEHMERCVVCFGEPERHLHC